MELKVIVKNKIAKFYGSYIVCGNSDYTINFNFDSEWDAYETKTARFEYNGTYIDVIFTGSTCNVPVIQNTHLITVGVYAGDLHTTTPAIIPAKISILCGSGTPAAPSDDVYSQIMELLNNLEVGGMPQSLKTAFKNYFTNIQTLINQMAFITGENIGNTLISNAQSVVTALSDTDEPTNGIVQDGDTLKITGNITVVQNGSILVMS